MIFKNKLFKSTFFKSQRQVFAVAIVLASLIPVFSFGQNTGHIQGSVRDKNNKALPSVTVSLLQQKDSSLVNAAISDTAGKFDVIVGKSGNYIISFSLVGYQKKYSSQIMVSTGQTIVLDPQILEESAVSLSAVTISSKKSAMESDGNKTVLNVQQSITATGSSAFELLQKTPGVQMDNNNNINIKGKNGVKICVDGRMMQLDNQDIASFLKGINSTEIEAIELISNPGAKYDAAGNAGIINIRFKKNKKYGTNGSVNLSVIQGLTTKGTGNADLSYRNDRINAFGSIGGSLGSNQVDFNLRRIQVDTLYDERTINHDSNNGINAKMGIDYNINDKNIIGAMITANYNNANHTSTGSTPIYDGTTGDFIKTLRSSSNIPGSRTNADFNLNYRSNNTNTQVNFDADYGLFRSRSDGYEPNYYYGANNNVLYSVINTINNPTDINIYTAKLDLVSKVGKGRIEYGAKVSYVHTKNAYDFYVDTAANNPVELPNQSSNFSYKENVNAAYGNLVFNLGSKVTVQTGLRAEQTSSEGSLSSIDGAPEPDGNLKRNYLDIFPTVSFNWTANQDNVFNLVFSRRIDRPTYQNLNPFEIKEDQLTYFKGNPSLVPQYTDNVSLTHTFLSKINTSLGFSYVTHFETEVSDTVGNAIYAEPSNIGTQKIISFSIGSPLTVTNWWTGYAGIWTIYQMFNVAIDKYKVNADIPGYGANLQQSFVLGDTYSAEVNSWFIGPGSSNAEWHTKAMGGIDLGFQKLLFSKKATLKLSATDILNTAYIHVYGNADGVKANGSLIPETRTLRLSLSWRFGNSKSKGPDGRQTGLESEEKRIKKGS
jgi:iron complex outermembrane receptor protein